jgi:hypothetical protein
MLKGGWQGKNATGSCRRCRIPLTCSWLPGKTKINMVFFWAMGLLLLGAQAAELERNALSSVGSTLVMLLVMLAAWIRARVKLLPDARPCL